MNTADIGVIGLGVMGAAIARNFHSRGLEVAAYNRSADARDAFAAAHADPTMHVDGDLTVFVQRLRRPRKVLLMVTAGGAVDAVLAGLAPLLDDGDIVIDGGNSHFSDTARRETWAAARGLRFFGMGVSGGEEGALLGPAMMPGGDLSAWQLLKPILAAAAAVSSSGPCVGYCGRSGAGHFVKMVHNGIEYGDMQLIAEAWSGLRRIGQGDRQIAQTFAAWNDAELSSYLVEITADILRSEDPQTSGLLLDQILDVAGQKGTGRWTAVTAIELGVPIPTITAAVDARAMSARKAERVANQQLFAEESGLLAAGTTSGRPVTGVTAETLKRALGCAKLMSYTQGFDLIATGSIIHDFAIDRAESARIWTGGCIIRAAFLDRVRAAFTAAPELPLLFASDAFAEDVREGVSALRTTVAGFARAGLAAPAFAASLSYFETMTQGRGTAAMIQAQRDYFGAHTYRRVAAPDVAVHSQWADLSKLAID